MSGSAPAAEWAPGYTASALLRQGRRARIIRATRVTSGAEVVLKVLPPEAGRAEVGHLQSLDGVPGAVPLVDAGTSTDGAFFLVLPFYPDGSFGEMLAKKGPAPVQEAAAVSRSVSAALGALHSRGLVHDDVCPGNVLRAGRTPVLTGFGSVHRTGEALPPPPPSMESFLHSSPEALRGEPRTPASDVYQLASTIWTMLAGRPPFAGADDGGFDPARYADRVLGDEPDPMHRTDVSRSLRRVLARALAKNPGDRYAVPADFATAFERARTGRVAASSPPEDGPTAEADPFAPSDPSGAQASHRAAPSGPRPTHGSVPSGPQNPPWPATSGPQATHAQPPGPHAAAPSGPQAPHGSVPPAPQGFPSSGPRAPYAQPPYAQPTDSPAQGTGPQDPYSAAPSGPRVPPFAGPSGPQSPPWPSATGPHADRFPGHQGPADPGVHGTAPSGPQTVHGSVPSGPQSPPWPAASGPQATHAQPPGSQGSPPSGPQGPVSPAPQGPPRPAGPTPEDGRVPPYPELAPEFHGAAPPQQGSVPPPPVQNGPPFGAPSGPQRPPHPNGAGPADPPPTQGSRLEEGARIRPPQPPVPEQYGQDAEGEANPNGTAELMMAKLRGEQISQLRTWARLEGWRGNAESAVLPVDEGTKQEPQDWEAFEPATQELPRWRRQMHIAVAVCGTLVVTLIISSFAATNGSEPMLAAAESSGGEETGGSAEEEGEEEQQSAPDPEPVEPSPLPEVAEPSEVSLEDTHSAVTLNWTDNSGGTADYFVMGGLQGQEPTTLARTGPGAVTAQVNTPNNSAEYCFTVIAVEGSASPADEVCTGRAAERAEAERQAEEEEQEDEEEEEDAEDDEEADDADTGGGGSGGGGSGGGGSGD